MKKINIYSAYQNSANYSEDIIFILYCKTKLKRIHPQYINKKKVICILATLEFSLAYHANTFLFEEGSMSVRLRK